MCAVPNMAVFCGSLISCFPDTLLRYFLKDFKVVPVAPTVTDITFVFTFHMLCISIVRSLCFRLYQLLSFLSHEIATSINLHVAFSLSQTVTSGLLLRMVLSVCTVDCIIWLSYLHDVSTDFVTCLYKPLLSNCIPTLLHMLKCS